MILALVAVFGAVPAVLQATIQTAPPWARLALCAAALEIAYVAWMAVTPDWSTVRVVMLVFAVAAAGYAAATVVAMATPPGEELPLGMDEVRASAARWCGSVFLFHALAAYLCGRTSARWRRAVERMGK